MNGRIYDPLLGRFLSADLVVDGPGNLQGYNRYSYVKNNPLSFSDPTGFWQVTLAGAYGYGLRISFGSNQGQWNFGFTPGLGLGASVSFNPGDNLVGRLDAVKPEQKSDAGFFDRTAAGIGVRIVAEGGVPEALEVGGSLKVSAEGNSSGDTWIGTTVEGTVGNSFVGQAGGEAWAGAKYDSASGEFIADFDSSGSGWQYSQGGIVLIGVDCLAYGESANSDSENIVNQIANNTATSAADTAAKQPPPRKEEVIKDDENNKNRH